MAYCRSSWSSRMSWCRHSMSTTAVRTFSHKCETVWYQMFCSSIYKVGGIRRSVNIATVLLLFATVYTLTSALVWKLCSIWWIKDFVVLQKYLLSIQRTRIHATIYDYGVLVFKPFSLNIALRKKRSLVSRHWLDLILCLNTLYECVTQPTEQLKI